MADNFLFWTHGVSTVPELTPALTGHDNGLHFKPTGFGAIILQNAGTDNWFHLAIPTSTRLDDWPSYRHHAWLRMANGRSAIVEDINLHEADSSNQDAQSPRIYTSRTDHPEGGGGLGWSNRDGDFDFDLENQKCRGPLVMSVGVRFAEGNDRERTLRIFGAGVKFVERR